jgi:hypothetical protein
MAERARSESEALGRLAVTLEDPPALVEYPENMGTFSVFERIGGTGVARRCSDRASGSRVDP